MADLISDGMTRATWLTSLASTTSPSAAAVEAGVDLEAVLTPDGLAIELGDDEVDTSALNSTFSATAAGRGTVSIELTLKQQGRTAAPWTTFHASPRPSGYLVVRRGLPVATSYAASQHVEVYPVKAGDVKPLPPAPNEVAKFAVQLFPSADPVLDATCAA